MQCKKCGATVRSTYRYCPECGKRRQEPKDQYITTERRTRQEFVKLRREEDFPGNTGKKALAEAAWIAVILRLQSRENGCIYNWDFNDPAQEAQAYQVLEETKTQAAELYEHLLDYVAAQ